MNEVSTKPVSFARHQQMFWENCGSFDFASTLTECPIVAAEDLETAASFPIIFRKTEDYIQPIAVFSTVSDMPHPFVSRGGQWLAGYIPSQLRSYPFSALRQPGSDLFQLFVDENACTAKKSSTAKRFFEQDGTIAPELENVTQFFKTRARAEMNTTDLTETIDEFGLLRPIAELGYPQPDENCLGIDASLVPDLSDIAKLELIESGALRLIHAHLVSLTHFKWLEAAQRNISRQISSQYTKYSDRFGFMKAIAKAHEEEFPEFNRVQKTDANFA